jgi:anaerobic magnesium-protoporphyrin IX monomethyl ester cyclase
MNKVILYNPRSANSGHRLPNSILQIGASIHGIFEYVFVDGNLELNPLEKIRSYLDTGEYAFFASTVMPGPQSVEAIPITKKIKHNYPAIITIWGGYFPTLYYKVVLESGFVDYVIHGIGDYAFPELLSVLEKKNNGALNKTPDSFYQELNKVKNLIFLREGEIVRNNAEHKIQYSDLNPLPYSYLNTFYPIEKYVVKTFLGSLTTSYHSSMGCPFECSFCAIVPMFNSRLSLQKFEDIFKNIKYLKDNFGVNAIEFNDNEFFFSEQRVAGLAQLMIGENISWWAYGRIDILYRYKEETLQLMKESGCRMIFFGAETGNAEMLRSVKKGGKASVETSIQLLTKLKKFDIIPEYGFVVGLPAKTPQIVAEQIDEDLKFIKEIKNKYPDTEIVINFYKPIESDFSDIYKMAQEYGYRPPGTLEEWLDPDREICTFTPVKYYPWFPERSAQKVKNFITVLHAFHPSITDFQLSRFQKFIMKIVSFWRYYLAFYENPYEIKLLQKFWLKYKQPEEEGFYSEKT